MNHRYAPEPPPPAAAPLDDLIAAARRAERDRKKWKIALPVWSPPDDDDDDAPPPMLRASAGSVGRASDHAKTGASVRRRRKAFEQPVERVD